MCKTDRAAPLKGEECISSHLYVERIGQWTENAMDRYVIGNIWHKMEWKRHERTGNKQEGLEDT